MGKTRSPHRPDGGFRPLRSGWPLGPRHGLDILKSHFVADRQAMTAFGATAGEDFTAILGGHAGAETMLVHALAIPGLKRTLHKKISRAKYKGRQMYFPNPFKFKGMQASGAPLLRSGPRPDLAFWAGVIALFLLISGWRRQVVRANFRAVKAAMQKHFSISGFNRPRALGSKLANLGLYPILLYRAARDLVGFLTASYPKALRIAPGSERVLAAMRQGPCLFLTGHVHHFEALGAFLNAQGVPLKAIARPMSRPWAQSWLTRLRERIGLPVIWSQRPSRAAKRLATGQAKRLAKGQAKQLAQCPLREIAAEVGQSHLSQSGKDLVQGSLGSQSTEVSPFWMREAVRHVQQGGCLAMLWDQKPRTDSGWHADFFANKVICDPLPGFVLSALAKRQGEAIPVFAGFLQPSGEVRLTVLQRAESSRKEPSDTEKSRDGLAKRYHRWLEGVTLRFPCHAYWLLHRRFG